MDEKELQLREYLGVFDHESVRLAVADALKSYIGNKLDDRIASHMLCSVETTMRALHNAGAIMSYGQTEVNWQNGEISCEVQFTPINQVNVIQLKFDIK